VEGTLANEHLCWEAAGWGATLGETALTKEQRCSLLVVQAMEFLLAAARVTVSVDLVLPELGWPRTSSARRKLPQINARQATSALWRVAAIVQRDIEIACACTQGLVFVNVVQRNVKMACACAQGLVVVAIVQQDV
jgi:hypothetical protein